MPGDHATKCTSLPPGLQDGLATPPWRRGDNRDYSIIATTLSAQRRGVSGWCREGKLYCFLMLCIDQRDIMLLRYSALLQGLIVFRKPKRRFIHDGIRSLRPGITFESVFLCGLLQYTAVKSWWLHRAPPSFTFQFCSTRRPRTARASCRVSAVEPRAITRTVF